MDKKPVFRRLIADFIAKPLEGIIPREIEIPVDVPKIISLLGPRRGGKTSVLLHVIRQLRREVPSDRLVYVNFEDDRLFPLTLQDMDGFLQAYYELYPENREKKVWFFLDEIQEVEHWEKFVRRLYDQENCRIFLTGSSSKLLSRELASSLRGRTLPFEIFPLGFSEFLRFNEVVFDRQTSKGQAFLLHWLGKYLEQGGFPELVFLPPDLHRATVTEYLDLMLYRDLAERFSLRNPSLLKYLLKYTLTNLANPISINKVYNDLRSQGYKLGKNTVYDYVSYLEEAFAVFKVFIHSRSVRVQATNPVKVYTIDPAFKRVMSISEDRGRIFENIVFLELKRRGIHPDYWQDGQEVDFYWEQGELINACISFQSRDTLEREKNGLLKAMEKLNLRESRLLTWDQERVIEEKGKTIRIQPLWQFLLE